MASTRDFLAHGYYRLEPDLVWEIVERDLPALDREIQQILQQLP